MIDILLGFLVLFILIAIMLSACMVGKNLQYLTDYQIGTEVEKIPVSRKLAYKNLFCWIFIHISLWCILNFIGNL